MYFLRVDYIPNTGCGVQRIRGLYKSLRDCVRAVRSLMSPDYTILQVRVELCA